MISLRDGGLVAAFLWCAGGDPGARDPGLGRGTQVQDLARARARQARFDGSSNLSTNDEFNSRREEIHRITHRILESKRFEKEIKAVYIY